MSKKALGTNYPYKWKCRRNHIIYKSVDHIKIKRKFHCRKCYHIDLGYFEYTYKNLKKFISKKGGKFLSKKRDYYELNKKIKIKCNRGHIFKIRPAHLIQGVWCEKCFRERKRITIRGNKKKCAKCKKFKYFKNFPYQKNKYLNLAAYCRPCELKRKKEKENRIQEKNPMIYIRRHFRSYKSSAKKRGIKFNISKNELYKIFEKQKGHCALSGERMTHIIGKGHMHKFPTNISLDRIDSNRGYVKGNVRFICTILNNLKYNLTSALFFKIIKKMYEHKYAK